MPGGAEIPRGNVNLVEIIQVNIASGTVGTTTIVNVTVSVPGLVVGDCCLVSPAQNQWPAASPAANLDSSGGAWVGTNNVLSVAFQNATGSAITQTTALPYNILVVRAYNFSVNQTYPSAIV